MTTDVVGTGRGNGKGGERAKAMSGNLIVPPVSGLAAVFTAFMRHVGWSGDEPCRDMACRHAVRVGKFHALSVKVSRADWPVTEEIGTPVMRKRRGHGPAE